MLVPAVAAAAQADLVQSAGSDCLRGRVEREYPPLNSPPIVQAVSPKDDSSTLAAAACFDKTGSAAMWVTVASVNRTGDSPNTLLARFGAISDLLTVQYWSTTDHRWRPLVSSASAIVAAESTQSRHDYSPAELSTGDDWYYRITDTRSGRGTTYRLRMRKAELGRLVVETSNIDAIKQWGVTLYAANGLHTLYFLDERSPGVWAYYSITRVLPASFLAAGHEKSYVNRAIALYRH